MIKRREFIAGLGSAVALPLAARAQQADRMRRIGVLMPYDENEPLAKLQLSAFTQALAGLGWTDGRNVRIDLRWFGADTNRMRALAQELVGLQPDIILTNGTAVTAAVQRGDADDDPDRLCERGRPRRQRHCLATRPPERERHWFRHLRSDAGRQVA